MELHTGQILQILRQGECGYHTLFDVPTIRRALNTRIEIGQLTDSQVFAQVKEVVTQVLDLQDMTQQREYISQLPAQTQDILVRLYFRILDQYMKNRQFTLH